MSDDKITKHMLIDIKTGFVYGVAMDAEGNCKGAQSLNVAIETLDGRIAAKFGPLLAKRPGAMPIDQTGDGIPYGQTTFAVDLTRDTQKGELFTIVWPSKEDSKNGVLPQISKKELPDNLVKAGIAAEPKGKKGAKGAAVEDEEALKTALKNIEDMIGLGRAKNDIKQNIALARFNRMKEEMGLATKPISRHMVFTGNPGTGKTTFAREVAKVYHALGFIEKATVHEVKREDLVAGYVGQTAIKTKEQIDKAKGGILFIDEAYALSRGAGSPGDDGKDFGREAIDTLVAAMENMREDLIVIVAGYPAPMDRFINANEGLKSRFMTYITFDDYGVPELSQIMDFMLKERGYVMEASARDHAVKLLGEERDRAKKDFGNGRTVRNLVEKAEKELALRLQGENRLVKDHGLSEENIKKALTTITLADMKLVSFEGITEKKESTGLSFGSAPKQIPANDAKPPVPAAPPSSAKKKAPRPGM